MTRELAAYVLEIRIEARVCDDVSVYDTNFDRCRIDALIDRQGATTLQSAKDDLNAGENLRIGSGHVCHVRRKRAGRVGHGFGLWQG